ncbi:MAG: hypothetical protein Fur0022_35580 [Anaerolineales bacterium]
MTSLTELRAHLKRWTRWYRFRQAVHWLGYGLAGGLALALLMSLVLIFRGQLLENSFFALIAGSASAGIVIACLAAWLWPFPALKAARYFDQSFGLKERTSTALELNLAREADPAQTGETDAPRAFALRQLDDALLAARQINPRTYLPVRVRWQEIALNLALGAGLFFTWYRGDTFFQIAQNFQAVQQAIEAQGEELEELAEEIENNPLLTDEQKEELTQPLEEAIQELQNAETMEQAVSILKETEQQLQEIGNEQALAQAQDLQDLGEQMSQQPGGALEQFAENLAEGDLISAANDLENLDLENMTPEELAETAEQLEQAAEALQDSNPELAEELQQAAEAIQNGDIQSAQQALQQASQTMQGTAQQAAQAQAAQQAANQAQQGQQQVIQSGQPQNQTAQNGQGQEGQQGQNGQQGQGNEQGQQGQNGQGQGEQGQGNGQGQNSGSGAGQGSTQGGTPGNEAGDDPIGQGNNPGDGGMTGFEPIGANPGIEDGGETVTLPGSGEAGENVTGEGNANPGAPGSSTVPYTEVLPTYSNAAIEAIENGLVPPGYRDLIRDYFSSLEPD